MLETISDPLHLLFTQIIFLINFNQKSMKSFIISVLSLSFLALSNCTSETTRAEVTNVEAPAPDMHTSQIALDWTGSYVDTIPCADCRGILTEVQLFENQTYIHRSVFIGKSKEIYTSNGKFEWDDTGSTITLLTKNDGVLEQYKVGENILFQLDTAGNRIEGDLAPNYELHKTSTSSLSTSVFYKLERLYGSEESFLPGQTEEIHFKVDTAQSMIYGNAGCNTFRGGYTTKNQTREVVFQPMAVTMMACGDSIMKKEQLFLSLFEKTKTFAIQEDSIFYFDVEMNEIALFVGSYIYP